MPHTDICFISLDIELSAENALYEESSYKNLVSIVALGFF